MDDATQDATMEEDGIAWRGPQRLRFLGVGASSAQDLGTAAAVLEVGHEPQLLIDCGQGTPARFEARYDRLPHALFITHVHLDHVAGLEQLYTRLVLGRVQPTRLYVPAPIVTALHERLGSLRFALAEGGGNFWDAFQLVPVGEGFWHSGRWFDVFPARHHAPGFAWGLRLAGRFLFTGDTRPIPETLRHFGATGERLFHDCAWRGNPSHTGWDDVLREYEPALRRRLVLYHYESAEAGSALRAAGARVADAGEAFVLGGDERMDGAPDQGPGLRIAS